MGDFAHITHHTNPGKNHHFPFFWKMRTFFQKSASMVVGGAMVELQPRRPIFEKSSSSRKSGRC
jgi:hypothetical protein